MRYMLDTAKLKQFRCYRDLVQGNEQYCIAFAQRGAIEPLIGLLDADSKELSLTIAQSVACMVQHASVRTEVR